jgi:hypothetical protein
LVPQGLRCGIPRKAARDESLDGVQIADQPLDLRTRGEPLVGDRRVVPHVYSLIGRYFKEHLPVGPRD